MAAWIIPLFVLLAALQILAVAGVMRRAMWVSRTLRDPERLRGLLSSETLAALRRAGLDPASPDIREIQKSPELQRLLAADLKKLMHPRLLNPFHRMEPLGPGAEVGHGSRPPPIDAPGGSGLRVAVALAMLGLAAVALFVLLARP